jgi:response regulator RpfG family c-di-GMP phosphodiesterase
VVEHQPDCPVLLVSSVPASQSSVDFVHSQPNRDLFMKPFDITRLREKVMQYLSCNEDGYVERRHTATSLQVAV